MIKISIPESLYRSEEAVIVAQRLIESLDNPCYSKEKLSWDKADIDSLQTFNHINFTDNEQDFFDRLLQLLDDQ